MKEGVTQCIGGSLVFGQWEERSIVGFCLFSGFVVSTQRSKGSAVLSFNTLRKSLLKKKDS